MLKRIRERQYFYRNNSHFFHNIFKSVECNGMKPLYYSKVCIDFTLEPIENKFLLCAYVDGNIIIYNVESFLCDLPQQVTCLYDSKHPIINRQQLKCIQWYPVDSGMFFSCGSEKKIKVWDTNKMKCVEEISITHNTHRIALSPCARFTNLVAAACDRNRTILIDMISGSSTHVLTNNLSEAITTVQWSNREEHVVVTGDQGGHISIWDIRVSRKPLYHLDQYQSIYTSCSNGTPISQAHCGIIRGIEFSPDGLSMATLGNDGRINVWNIFSNKILLDSLNFGKLFETDKSGKYVRFCWTGSSKHKNIWIPSELDIISLNVVDGSKYQFPSMHFDQITSCIWNVNHNQLYSSSLDSNILHWNFVI